METNQSTIFDMILRKAHVANCMR